jgi:hypothetical protein
MASMPASWPTPYKVTLLSFSLTLSDSIERERARKYWGRVVCAAALAVGWDTSSRVAYFTYEVERAWLRAVCAKSGMPDPESPSMSGVQLAAFDASDADITAACHVACIEVLRSTAQKWNTPYRGAVDRIPGYEHMLDWRDVKRDLISRGVLLPTDSGESGTFFRALRAQVGTVQQEARAKHLS